MDVVSALTDSVDALDKLCLVAVSLRFQPNFENCFPSTPGAISPESTAPTAMFKE